MPAQVPSEQQQEEQKTVPHSEGPLLAPLSSSKPHPVSRVLLWGGASSLVTSEHMITLSWGLAFQGEGPELGEGVGPGPWGAPLSE